jgi:hypothetical protein
MTANDRLVAVRNPRLIKGAPEVASIRGPHIVV